MGESPKDTSLLPSTYQHYINRFLKPLSEIALKKTAYESALEETFSDEPQLSLFEYRGAKKG